MAILTTEQISYLRSLPSSGLQTWLNDIASRDESLAAAIVSEMDDALYATDSRNRVATFFDVAPETIDLWVKKGMPYTSRGKGVKGAYSLQECARWLAQQRMIAPENDERQVAADAAYREEKWKIAELQRKRLEGLLVELDLVRAKLMMIITMIRKGVESFHRTFGNEAVEQLAAILDEVEKSIGELGDE